jgi:hypothetical protein
LGIELPVIKMTRKERLKPLLQRWVQFKLLPAETIDLVGQKWGIT